MVSALPDEKSDLDRTVENLQALIKKYESLPLEDVTSELVEEVSSKMDEIGANHPDSKEGQKWRERARAIRGDGGPGGSGGPGDPGGAVRGRNAARRSMLGDFGMGLGTLGMLIGAPLALAGAAVFTAGAMVCGAGFLVKGIGRAVTFGMLDEESSEDTNQAPA